jgi:hypothetical protein
LGILVLAGLVLAFGAYKTVSCCQDTLQQHRQVVETGLSFGRAVSNARYEEAWSKTSPRYRNQTDVEAFRARFDDYRDDLKRARLHLQGVNTKVRKGGSRLYRMTLGFTRPESSNQIVLSLELIEVEPTDSAAETRDYRIDTFSLERRERAISKEPAAQTVRRFHSALAADRTSGAYHQWTSPSYKKQQNLDAFETFVQQQGEWLTSGSIEIQSVQYRDGGVASVLARHTLDGAAGDSQTRTVSYRLQKTTLVAWKITGITPEATDLEAPSGDEGTSPDTGTTSPHRDASSTPDASPNEPSSDIE